MAAGDRQVMKAMEEVTTNNIKAMLAHGNETRRLVRELEDKLRSLDGFCRQQQDDISKLRLQLANVQTKVFSGGT